MTPIKVVDASALGALIFNEQAAEKIVAMLEESTLIAPLLLVQELDSICVKKIKAQPKQRKKLIEARRLADDLSITLSAVNHTEVIELAVQTGLTAYDASYLWLAKNTGNSELVTLDARLAKAAVS